MARLLSFAASCTVLVTFHTALAGRNMHNKKQGSVGFARGDLSHRMTKYTFDEFKVDFGRTYQEGSAEHEHRRKLFEASLLEMREHNAQNLSYIKDVNHMSDLTEEEKKQKFGYNGRIRAEPRGTSLLQREEACGAADMSCVSDQGPSPCCSGLVCGVMGVCEKAKQQVAEHDWTEVMPTAHQIIEQGACGSCWAMAAAAALEMMAHISAMRENKRFTKQLSPQSLLSCTLNERHCGGDNGCQGATAEVAYDSLWKQNRALKLGLLPLEYQPYTARADCDALDASMPSLRQQPGIRLKGYVALPNNNAEAFMNTLLTVGPFVASLAANGLHAYGGGVFPAKSLDWILNHAVIAMGFGKDKSLNMNYWKVRNSWGPDWGENGYFRLQRFYPDEPEPCGIDTKPEEGVACMDANGNYEKQQKVCGAGGFMYDSTYGVPEKVPDTFLEAVGEGSPLAAMAAKIAASSAGGAAPVMPTGSTGLQDLQWCNTSCQHFQMTVLSSAFNMDFGSDPGSCMRACTVANEKGLLARQDESGGKAETVAVKLHDVVDIAA
eukprot:TRINITY_DN15842_c0_g1_i1.p1 TRINITY_DN15842_c0_g1~~TRINITY_DN15842_c0_g1_i1.p1  ORF type:complete len:567 (+),score=134.74 TRINITY_DN15842_c0_g1_i1:54-1703(+)